jgi:hypothetical protein
VSTWTVEEQDNGLWDVLLDRRIVVYDRDDPDEAAMYIRRHRSYQEGDRIEVVSLDGTHYLMRR